MRRALAWLLRLGLGGMLVLAGMLKLRAPADFAAEIANYRLLPALAPWLAATLPMIEVALGLALVVAPRAWRRSATLATFGLLVVFTVALAQVVARGIDVSCGCFGEGSGSVTGWTVARDLALLGATALLYWLDGNLGGEGEAGGASGPAPWGRRRESRA